MKLEDYLKTILTTERIRKLKRAIKDGTPIKVTGGLGKTTLVHALRSLGVNAFEDNFDSVCEIKITKKFETKPYILHEVDECNEVL